MKTSILLSILGIVLIAAGAFYFFGKPTFDSPGNQPLPKTAPATSKPWIEVISPLVFEIKPNDDSKIRELKTGDELSAGIKIEVAKNGRANIHFPDGSAARFEPNTKFVLSEGSFDAESEKLTIKISLVVGRVWSKIITLVTPDSLWEVKTANAVATVRGTAFGMEFFTGNSRIFGAEDSVPVAALDPQTKEVIKGTEKIVVPEKFIEIKNVDISKIKEKPELVEVKTIPAAIVQEDFFRRNQAEDARINEKIKELEKAGLENKELRKAFRESIIKEFEEEIEKRRIEILEETNREEKVKEQIEEKPNIEPERQEAKEEPRLKRVKKALSLSILSKNVLDKVVEGDKINFEAIAEMSDGSRINVTALSQWQVLGQIGRIERPGVFVAELAPAVAEFGESSGSVIATWQDPESREALLGKSPIFKVEAKVIEPSLREG
ncbi:MAG: FecR domain-containing protein [Candidatus Magasanikbacteria bacterium]|nr:FecR domain-containing protein [Candidatus Magasanikbacteria bacterium]